jgi:hypothetical protein
LAQIIMLRHGLISWVSQRFPIKIHFDLLRRRLELSVWL